MDSSLASLQPKAPMSEAELKALGKRCVLDQRRLMVNLDDVTNETFMEHLTEYSKRRYNVIPEFKHRTLKGWK